MIKNRSLPKTILHFTALSVLYTLIFSVLMVACYALLPSEGLVKHAVKSAEDMIVYDEDAKVAKFSYYPRLYKGKDYSQLDNYTEGFVLGMAVHKDDLGIRGAFLQPHYENEALQEGGWHPEERLKSVIEGEGKMANAEYGRYWHGHLLVEFPLFMFTDLKGIYVFFAVIMAVFFAMAAYMLWKKAGIFPVIALVISLLLVHIWYTVLSTKFFYSFAIALFGIFLIAVKADAGEGELGSIFFGLGAVTVFLDFMSTPVVSMGLPLIALIIIKRDELGRSGAAKAAGFAMKMVLSWLLGWGILGLANWVIYTVALGDAGGAVQVLSRRVALWSWSSDPSRYGRLLGIMRVILIYSGRFRYPILAGLLLLIALPVFVKKNEKSRGARAAIAVVALMPFVWWLAVNTSVARHYWAVYRTIAVVFFGILCEWGLLTGDIIAERKGDSKRQEGTA